MVGVDGCKAGWLCAMGRPDEHGLFSADDVAIAILPDVEAIVAEEPDANLVVIDIPIGLSDSGSAGRSCDKLAREMLGKRRVSVFSPPCRDAVYAKDYPQACQINRSKTGKAFSKQAWNITGKIREVDTFLQQQPIWSSRLIESHPEVCFAGLAGQPMQYRKKDQTGFKERIAVLKRWITGVRNLVESAWRENHPRQYHKDDLLDALVNLVVAASPEQAFRRLPDEPPLDSRGLPMQMVYRDEELA